MKKLYQAIKNNDDGVFKCPDVSGQDIYGYKKVNEYFVDNSGFGSISEPALTASQFLQKVKQGFYYGIIAKGQFQVYIGEFLKDNRSKKEVLQGKEYISRKKLDNNTYEYIKTTGEKIIKLHNTDILTFTDNKVILNTGEYKTHTTKQRLNKYLNCYNISLYQKNYNWYIKQDNNNINFKDNIELIIK